MALVHPLHPIKHKSWNKRRNLWVGWCISSWWPRLWSINSIYHYIHTVYYSYILSEIHIRNKTWCGQDSLCHNMDMGNMWYCALVSCTPSHAIGLFFGCALFWCSVSCAVFTNCLIECYFIMMVANITRIFYGHSPHFELHTWAFCD